jgi:uncharacterized protein YjgD (DUF1641 family)
MVEEDKELTNKDPKFNLILDMLIKKYEYRTSHGRNEVFAFGRFYIAIIIGFIPLYLGWSIESIKKAFLTLWSTNSILQIIVILIIFSALFLGNICANWILRRKSVENFVQKNLMKHLMINNYLESDTKLNKLYLAKINSEGWAIKIKQDEEIGIFELIDILKQKPPSNNLI